MLTEKQKFALAEVIVIIVLVGIIFIVVTAYYPEASSVAARAAELEKLDIIIELLKRIEMKKMIPIY